MQNVALLVAEAPWFSPKENHTQASCLPFFEGARKLINHQVSGGKFNIYNCNFFDSNSLEQALNHLIKTEEDKQILYLGGHGDGENIADANLEEAIQHVRNSSDKIKGLIVSSCWGAMTDTLSDALSWAVISTKRSIKEINGPNWVIGYRHPVYWFKSALLETALIQSFASGYMNNPKGLNSKDGIISYLLYALSAFDINQPFAEHENKKYSIKDTIRIWVRPQGTSNSREITEEFFNEIEMFKTKNKL